MDLKQHIRTVQNYPKPGINFYDITTLLANPIAFDFTVTELTAYLAKQNIDKVVALEARGFIFASAIADRLKKPLVLIRKAGKLPHTTVSQAYNLEYGSDTMEIHSDSIEPHDRIAIVDDLLATGGTMAAACKLLESLQANIISLAVVVALNFLPYKALLKNHTIYSLTDYEQ